ncbi:thymidylate synthase [Xanthomonas cannabis]|uniref:thymidylate synthase n=1 Tax=Xanthomonas cannabis TaxID=1885674 RepID=UPI0033B157D1
MNIGIFSSSNEVQRELCRLIVERGEIVKPRGMETRELLGLSFTITNPRRRLTTLPGRLWSSALAVGELAWHLRGDTNVEPLAFYAPKWRQFADKSGQVRGSCYGAKIFEENPQGFSQWSRIRSLLSEDPYSRRAVLGFQTCGEISSDVKDVSCTISLQFIIRDGLLHAFTAMRSNDAIWGVPYDIFLFTSFQEIMAAELGVGVGSYHHSAASMHIYAWHYELARKVSEISDNVLICDDEMVPMDKFARTSIPTVENALRNGYEADCNDAFSEMCRSLLLENKKVAAACGVV